MEEKGILRMGRYPIHIATLLIRINMKSEKKKKAQESLSLANITFEQALKKALNTPLPRKNKKKGK